MNHILLLLVLLLYCLSVTSTAADSPPTTASTGCSDELVTFSTCLPYVAVFPNNLTDSPSPLCCDDVAAVFGNGSSVCLCYFLLRPKILGFPLNSTKLLSLTSVCQLKDKSSKADLSIGTLCSGSAALPPLQSITGPSNAKSRNNGADSPPPPLRASAQESSGNSSTEEPAGGNSPTEEPAGGNSSTDEPAGGSSSTEKPADKLPPRPSSSAIPVTISSATQRTFTFTWTLLTFLSTF